jgi:hypothetical protein
MVSCAFLLRMTSDEFWQIIDATAAPTQEEQIERLRHELRRRNAAAIVEYQQLFTAHLFAAYNWDIWLVAWLCGGGMCSDDSFTDFRSWLISRGRRVYETAMSTPDELIGDIASVEYSFFEEFAYIPAKVYEARIGKDIPDSDIEHLEHPKEPSGGAWLRPQLKDRSGSKMLNRCVVFNELGDEEFSAIEREFPKTWAYCVEQGIIKPASSEPSTSEPAVKSNLPSPEEIAASVDPNLAKTDFLAYVKALGEAAQRAYNKKKEEE